MNHDANINNSTFSEFKSATAGFYVDDCKQLFKDKPLNTTVLLQFVVMPKANIRVHSFEKQQQYLRYQFSM
jgi:hypothetical protein